MKNKEVDIEASDGKVFHIQLREITRGERKVLNEMMTKDQQIDVSNPSIKITMKDLDKMRDQLISYSLINPKEIPQDFINNISDSEYNKLWAVVDELSGLFPKMSSVVEKK